MKRSWLVPVGLLVGACSSSGGSSDSPPGASDDGGAPEGAVETDGGTPPPNADGAAPEAAPPCGGSGRACCAEYVCGPGLACDGATCAAAVTEFACPAGSKGAVFVTEAAPPAALEPWAHAYASVTYANCGSAAWTAATSADAPSGMKLGAAAPRDADTFTPGRVVLPADVPPGHKVLVPIVLHAPPLTGDLAYGFDLVDEGAAWLGVPSPVHTIHVDPKAAAPIAICTGVTADPSGGADATHAIQSCLDAAAPGATVALPAGIYRVSGVLHLGKPLTLTTEGAVAATPCIGYDAARCAVLRADATTLPSSAKTRGFVRLGELDAQVTSITLDHVVVDGNRAARLGGPAASACAAANNGEGINVGANCAGCTIVDSASVRAVCGSGMEWDGDRLTVKRSVFFGNGDHATANMWSDGLTIHKSDEAVVDGCRFVDNSDVGFISGGGVNAHYTNNTAQQIAQSSFAAMMLDNFNNGALGDFTGTELTGNTVVCSAPCHFGIELGPHPWYGSPNIKGGAVTKNTVLGAYLEINAEGAGTAAAPTVIADNTLGPTPASAPFTCGVIAGLTPLNVSSESVVDLKGGAATGAISVPCP